MPGPYDQSAGFGTGYSAFAVVPADSGGFGFLASGLYVGGAGNISMVMADGTVVSLVGVPVGTVLQFIQFVRINSTGTTATNLVAFR